MQAGLEGSSDVSLHRVADHDDLIRRAQRQIYEFSTCSMEHVPIGLADIIRSTASTCFEESCCGSGAGTGPIARNRTPVIRIGREQSRALFDAFMSLGEFFHAHSAFTHYDVAWPDRVI